MAYSDCVELHFFSASAHSGPLLMHVFLSTFELLCSFSFLRDNMHISYDALTARFANTFIHFFCKNFSVCASLFAFAQSRLFVCHTVMLLQFIIESCRLYIPTAVICCYNQYLAFTQYCSSYAFQLKLLNSSLIVLLF